MTDEAMVKRRTAFRGPVGFTPAESKIAVGLAMVVLIASLAVVYQRLIRPAPPVSVETLLIPTGANSAAPGPAQVQRSAVDRIPSPPTVAGLNVLDINIADYADLVRLPGIGPVLAGRIMEYRDRHGLFVAVDSLINVSGIGRVKLEKIRPLVCIR